MEPPQMDSQNGQTNQRKSSIEPGIAWENDPFSKPKNCPGCSEELIEPRARRPHWVKFLYVGTVILGLLGGMVLVIIADSTDWLIGLGQAREWIINLLFVVPLAIGHGICRKARRVLPFECYNCGWKMDFPLPESHQYDLPKDNC